MSTAVIAFLVAGIAALCATRPEKRWMWATPLWLAPLVMTAVLGIRHLVAHDAGHDVMQDGSVRFFLSLTLTMIWLPSALLGWKLARAYAGYRN